MGNLSKLEYAFAQPDATHLSIKDVTPTGVDGGWDGPGMPALIDATTSVLTIKHHTDSAARVLNVDSPYKDQLFPLATQGTDWGFSDNIIPDGIYVFTASISGLASAESTEQIFMLIADVRKKYAKFLIYGDKILDNGQRREYEGMINRLRLDIDRTKALVLVDNYTDAVTSFVGLSDTISQLEQLMLY